MISLLLALQAAAAASAGAASPPPNIPPCAVQHEPTQSSYPGNVVFSCWSSAVPLGIADKFISAYNPSTRGTVIVLESGGAKRVMLISPTVTNVPVTEDVTRDLAKLAGRYADAGLDGVNVDISHFPTEGTLTLTGNEGGTNRANNASFGILTEARTFDIKPFATRALSISNASQPELARGSHQAGGQ